ncbi:MAG: CapA family protein [Candidatus Bathyarchaeota archaeon]|nr:MAG: CapA family protein [Candidatus Bathyarchaeota archaeon]
MDKKLTLVATGDSLITMRMSVHSEPEFIQLVELIRDADLAFTNFEMLVHDYQDNAYPAAQSGGTYMRAPPHIIEEIKWMGVDLVSTANNHSLDYSYGGLFSTKEQLDRADLPHAGTGKDLAEARRPTYMETPQGRVALIAASSSFAPFGRAGAARKDMQGRPGLNSLRYDTWYTVASETLQKIKNLEKEIGFADIVQPEDPNEHHLLRTKFVAGEDIGAHTKPNKSDMDGNLESIREACRQADWVLFSLHAHEGAWNNSERPADFVEEFARGAIDAGAHAVIGHGHHAMRGIEIRDGRPIFYSLGDFIFQNQTVEKMPSDFYARYKLDPYSGTPADAYDARTKPKPAPGRRKPSWFGDDEKYWISIVPAMSFEGDTIAELKLHPIELGWKKPRSQRGRPVLAEGELADKIISIITELSKPYGTQVSNDGGVGVVSL